MVTQNVVLQYYKLTKVFLKTVCWEVIRATNKFIQFEWSHLHRDIQTASNSSKKGKNTPNVFKTVKCFHILQNIYVTG